MWGWRDGLTWQRFSLWFLVSVGKFHVGLKNKPLECSRQDLGKSASISFNVWKPCNQLVSRTHADSRRHSDWNTGVMWRCYKIFECMRMIANLRGWPFSQHATRLLRGNPLLQLKSGKKIRATVVGHCPLVKSLPRPNWPGRGTGSRRCSSSAAASATWLAMHVFVVHVWFLYT